MDALPEPTAVVCHDAGAANLVLAEMRQDPRHVWLPVLEGPAERLWRAAGAPGAPALPLPAALAAARSVLSGTGWASDLEYVARREARARGLPSVAMVDHWVNYEERFLRAGVRVLPDALWVTDPDALAVAQRTFPGLPVQLRPNHYLRAQVEAVAAAGQPQPGRILVLLEPIRYRWPGLAQPGEFEALDYLVRHLALLRLQVPPRLVLRPHPSDAPGKYDDWVARQHGLAVAVDTQSSLAESIAAAEWVTGCETAALVVALAAGRKALSTLPPAAPRCRLPQAGLMHLRELAGADPAAGVPGPPLPR